jgi:hypothetical protein
MLSARFAPMLRSLNVEPVGDPSRWGYHRVDNRERGQPFRPGYKQFKGTKPCYVLNASNRWQTARDFAEVAAKPSVLPAFPMRISTDPRGVP